MDRYLSLAIRATFKDSNNSVIIALEAVIMANDPSIDSGKLWFKSNYILLRMFVRFC